MIITIIIVLIALIWLLYETDYMRVRLIFGEGIKPKWKQDAEELKIEWEKTKSKSRSKTIKGRGTKIKRSRDDS